MKVLFIGNADGQRAMATKIRPNWDWQRPVTTIQDYWNANDLDDNTAIVIISNEFYLKGMQLKDKNMVRDFLDLVYQCSQFVLTMIVNYGGHEKTVKSVNANLMKYSSIQKDGKSLSPYYWIDFHKPNVDIDKAIKQYINSTDSPSDVVDAIVEAEHISKPSHETPKHNAPVDDDIDDFLDDAVAKPADKIEYTNNYKRKGLVYCFTSTKGGAGKTSTSLATGTWIAKSSAEAANAGRIKAPLKVCIVDLDVADGQIGTVIKTDGRTTVMKIISSPVTNVETVGSGLVYNDRMGCWFLLAPKMPRSSYTIQPDKYAQIIEILKTMFDVIILDTSVHYTEDLFAKVVYPKSDKIIFITTVDKKAVVGLGKWIIENGSPRKEGIPTIPLNKVKVVVNQAMKNVDMGRKEIDDIIHMTTAAAYHKLDKTIPATEWKYPQMLSVIPSIKGGALTKWSNVNQFEMTLNIKEYEKYIARLASKILPDQFDGLLQNIEQV
jgi:MinD-like ATPase involved in chromosome partitioning or flagellar assembly